MQGRTLQYSEPSGAWQFAFERIAACRQMSVIAWDTMFQIEEMSLVSASGRENRRRRSRKVYRVPTAVEELAVVGVGAEVGTLGEGNLRWVGLAERFSGQDHARGHVRAIPVRHFERRRIPGSDDDQASTRLRDAEIGGVDQSRPGDPIEFRQGGQHVGKISPETNQARHVLQ